MNEKIDRDVETSYPLADFVAKLRRFADALEAGERLDIEIDGERILVPDGALFSIEHEREDGEAEIEFQVKWTLAADDEGDEEEEEGDDEEEGEEEEDDEESDEAEESEEEDDEAEEAEPDGFGEPEEESGEAEETLEKTT